MMSLPKMTWMPDINIASGGGGGMKYVIFTGLLPLCPKSSGQGCRKSETWKHEEYYYYYCPVLR